RNNDLGGSPAKDRMGNFVSLWNGHQSRFCNYLNQSRSLARHGHRTIFRSEPCARAPHRAHSGGVFDNHSSWVCQRHWPCCRNDSRNHRNAKEYFYTGFEHNRHDNDSAVCRKFRIHSSGKCAAEHDSIRHEHILRSTIHPNGHPADHNWLSAHWTSVCHVLEVSWISLISKEFSVLE